MPKGDSQWQEDKDEKPEGEKETKNLVERPAAVRGAELPVRLITGSEVELERIVKST